MMNCKCGRPLSVKPGRNWVCACGASNHNPDGFQFTPIIEPWKANPLAENLALTSLSTKRLMEQKIALNSWVQSGFKIACVSSSSEIEFLKSEFPQVLHWIREDNTGAEYSKPTQRIKRMLDHCIPLLGSSKVMLINSDIEIYCNKEEIAPYTKPNSRIDIGVRNNYQINTSNATLEPDGLDVFFLSKEQIELIPDLPFSIGKPVWDYWIPALFKEIGCEINIIQSRIFFHRSHKQQWSQEEWIMGAKWLEQTSGIFRAATCAPFRRSFDKPTHPGVGSILSRKFARIYPFKKSTCNCNRLEKLMNEYGPSVCRQEIDYLTKETCASASAATGISIPEIVIRPFIKSSIREQEKISSSPQ